MKTGVMALAIACAFYNASCDKPVCDCPAFPNGDTITVAIKEKANVYSCCNDRFAITFDNVKEDSRCPDGFNCLVMNPVWAGTARIFVKINGLQHMELQIGKPTTTNAGGHTIRYCLLILHLIPNRACPPNPIHIKP